MSEVDHRVDSPYKKNKPFDELSFLFEKFGWQTRLCDLNEKQVMSLIYAIQECERIDNEHATGKLEDAYFESTGSWPIASIPF